MKPKRIALAEALEQITAEIRQAHTKATAEGNPVMKFQECEMEFAIQAEGGGSAGVKVWVLEIGGNLKQTHTNTLKIKYTALATDIVAPLQSTEAILPKPRRQGKKVK